MKKSSSIFQGVTSTLVLVILFVVHLYLNKMNEWVSLDFLWKSYFVLVILTVLFFSLFGIAKIKFKDHLGFLYLFWVLVKFIVLFIIFYSEVNDNLATKKTEVISLLIPYLISIFLSAFPLSRELNKSEVS